MKAIISASFAVLLVGTQLCAATYYVNSVTGSDTNPGTQAAPFSSAGQLNKITVNPGDTIYFARGTSYSGYFEFTQSGTTGLPITFTSYGTGNIPEFINPNQWYAIRLSGNYLVLDGVKIHNTHESGAVIWGSNCVVQNCEITDTGLGVTIGGAPSATQHARVTGNFIHHLHMVTNDATPTNNDSGATAIVISNAVDGSPSDDIDIGWNRISYCIADSPDYGKDGGAFEFYNASSHVQIHHNWCDWNNGVFEVGFYNGGTISHVQIYYNLFEHNGVLGSFHLAGGSSYTGAIADFRVENNTVFDTATGISNGVIWFDGTGSADQLSITNNIFYYLGFSVFSNTATFAHNYNLYWGSPIGYTPNATEIIADPSFVNPSAEDFRLQSTSAAINAGLNLGYSFDRQANPIVNTPDLGAYESPY